jgi:hypothetical protein
LQRAAFLQRLTGDELGSYMEAFSGMARRMRFVTMNRRVVARASGTFPHPIRALDAIHLATALLARDQLEVPNLVFATHDRQQAACATALGFDVIGVPA